MAQLILLSHAAATLAMFGLIWFVQVVHYPLFGQVGRDQFPAYERVHQARTTIVVMPLMLVEASTAILLLWVRPPGIPLPAALVGVALVAAIWVSTFCWQVPAHAKLAASYDSLTHRRLVRSNWVRTITWTVRTALVCWMICCLCH